MTEPFDYGHRKADGQYEHYPSEPNPDFVQPLRNEYIHLTCGVLTRMNGAGLVRTYATNPTFYGSTFCCGCGDHFPLDQFVWCEKGERTETRMNEVKGTPGEDLTAHGFVDVRPRSSYIS
ncbi:MAG: hypothetical protein IVW52_04975 [Acidimicrobiales bacterium]|nr:hypothetical protein [Acidimicrobiales bacterium]